MEYQAIKALKREFDSEHEKARETGNLVKVKELRAVLEKKRGTLAEKLWPFREISQKEFRARYEEETEILKNAGLLEKLPGGKLGIGESMSINGKAYTLPGCQEVLRAMRKEKETFDFKAGQGLNQPLIAPFAHSIDFMAQRYGELIIQKFKEGKLLDSEGNVITDLRKQGEGDDSKNDAAGDKEYYPLWKWEKYTGADKTGQLVYFPKEFSPQNHQGQTKKQLLEKQGGFLVSLIEDLPDIPRATNDPKEIAQRTKGGRRQLEAGQFPKDYLKLMQREKDEEGNPNPYRHESGWTLEEWLTYAIIHLEKAGQVLDDYQGRGSVSYETGSYFPASGGVPYAGWDRGNRRADLGRSDSGSSDSRIGVRGAVRVKMLKT